MSSQRLAVVRLLSSAVVSQALLSAASFAVGLLLIRHADAVQYGYFVLASGAIALLVSLQNAFFGPVLALRLTRLERPESGALVGGLYAAQNLAVRYLAAAALATVIGLWYAALLDRQTALLSIAGIVATLAILQREYFRLVLLAHRRPFDVLRGDVCHVALMLAGVFVATHTATPAAISLMALGIAAVASAVLLGRSLHRHEPWHSASTAALLRGIAPVAAWSTAGAAIHWTFSQGYIYLVAGTLDVAAVAAIAATRLLLMPVNLLSTGIGSLMLPLASGWLQHHGPALLLRRLGLIAVGLGIATLCYFAVIWLARDWIFAVLLKKQFAARDDLLLLWGLLFLVMVVRDQLRHLVSAQGRFRALSVVTLASACIALAASFEFMRLLGVTGALLGMLAGELINLAGIVVLAIRQPRSRSVAPA